MDLRRALVLAILIGCGALLLPHCAADESPAEERGSGGSPYVGDTSEGGAFVLSRAGAASFDADAYTCFLSDELRPGAGFSGAPQMKLSELQAVIGLGGAGGGMGGLGGAGECPTLGNVLPSDNGCTVFWEYRPRLSVVGYCCYSFGRWGCR